jgi:hypothetical protein
MRSPYRYQLAATLVFVAASMSQSAVRTSAGETSFNLAPVLEVSVGTTLGQCRAAPVDLGDEGGIFIAYCEDAEIDPYVEMFFFPEHRMKLMVLTLEGEELWKTELGAGVIPGVWFTPFFPFDLGSDSVDEIWFVNNVDDEHPLSLRGRRLERLDARTGRTLGQWPWPAVDRSQSPSHTFRNFILGGHVHGKPVLVTAQGTYGPMKIQGWNPDMSQRWEHAIGRETPGARGSHMCPVVDINNDGVDEMFWGERCIELDTGAELFCGDRDSYRGHSDVVQPVLDRTSGRWYVHSCRESGGVAPRVAVFDDTGRRVWGDLKEGHMDMGWTARIGPGGEPVAMAIRIGSKSAGRKGFFRKGVEEFTYEPFTGERIDLPFSVFCTLPVDLNGDGRHELVRGIAEGDGAVIDRAGRAIGKVGGHVAMASKFMDHPGEQILCYYADGTIRVWADRNAKDTPAARARYSHPFYQANRRLTATGYNLVNLGGI